jgi:hypothetical protein
MERERRKRKGVGTYFVAFVAEEEKDSPRNPSKIYLHSLCCFTRNHRKARSVLVEMAIMPYSNKKS